jgi:twitching motility protein PilT
MHFDINKLVELAASKGASDIHVINNSPIKCRIDGQIVDLTEEKVDSLQIEGFARYLLGDNYEKVALIGEADVGFTFPCGIRVRGNVYRQNRQLSIALRIFSNHIPKIDELGLPDCVSELPNLKNGIVLVTGETGAGKSTTLASILDRINHTRQAHIITLEDPVEYIFDADKCIISQREVGVDTKSYASGLRSILREDPDVIMIGEMRDFETIEAALTAAETGHLVFATLHTNSAADTLDRIVGVFPEGAQAQIKMQLSNTLCCVLTQKLLPKKDGSGRALACEAMVVNNAIRNLIREGKTHQLDSFISLSSSQGSVSMDASLLKLVQNGEISLELAEQYARNKENLRALCSQQQLQPPQEKGLFKRHR